MFKCYEQLYMSKYCSTCTKTFILCCCTAEYFYYTKRHDL